MAGAGGDEGPGAVDGAGRRALVAGVRDVRRGTGRRDGCTKVVVSGGSGDLGADVIGYFADGRKLVIQCKKYAPHRSVPSQDMQKFVGTARLAHGADVALFVTTCRAFTKAAMGLALRHDIVAVHRGLLGAWVKGAHLDSLILLNGSGGSGSRQRPSA